MPSQGVKLRLMDGVTEVRYGSVIVGRSPQIRDRNNAGAFVVFIEPLPVGTPIALKIDDKEMYARVTEVVESADEAVAGMRVRFVDSAERPAPAPKPMARVAPPQAAPTPAPAPAAAAPPSPAPAVAAPPSPAPAAAAPQERQEQHAAPVPVATEGSSASEAVHSSTDSAGHPTDPNAHHDGEGGRRRRRRK
jgi:hypothetical protein